MNWYFAALAKYADFSGRARRSEYWFFGLVNLGVYIALYALIFMLGFSDILKMVVGIALGLYALGVLIPSIAVSVRRLHDTNKSAWWLLISLVPFVGGIILLVFMCLDSDAGPNQFGPNPKMAGV